MDYKVVTNLKELKKFVSFKGYKTIIYPYTGWYDEDVKNSKKDILVVKFNENIKKEIAIKKEAIDELIAQIAEEYKVKKDEAKEAVNYYLSEWFYTGNIYTDKFTIENSDIYLNKRYKNFIIPNENVKTKSNLNPLEKEIALTKSVRTKFKVKDIEFKGYIVAVDEEKTKEKLNEITKILDEIKKGYAMLESEIRKYLSGYFINNFLIKEGFDFLYTNEGRFIYYKSKTTIMIKKSNLGNKIGRFIGKKGANIKAIEKEYRIKIVLT